MQVTSLNLGTYIVKTNTGYELIRNGENYYVKGAGGYQYLNQLKDIGGNSIRTWGVDNAKQILDDAHKLGITVCLGLWVGHERHGFNYDDEYAVEGQLESFKKIINEFKDHPCSSYVGCRKRNGSILQKLQSMECGRGYCCDDKKC